MERSSRLRRSFLFGLYCACMLWLLFGRWPNPRAIPFGEYLSTHLNVMPFRTIRLFGRLLVPPVRPYFVRAALRNFRIFAHGCGNSGSHFCLSRSLSLWWS